MNPNPMTELDRRQSIEAALWLAERLREIADIVDRATEVHLAGEDPTEVLAEMERHSDATMEGTPNFLASTILAEVVHWATHAPGAVDPVTALRGAATDHDAYVARMHEGAGQ